MKKFLAISLAFVVYSCGSAPDTSTAPSGLNCGVTGSGNVNNCGNGSVTVIIQPAVSPTPTPTPLPANACILGPSIAAGCAKVVDKLGETVRSAQTTISGTGYTETTYVVKVVEALQRLGVCATAGPSPDEVTVKTSNASSETFDVWSALNVPQTLYINTCTPARF